jgi:hypothetical protein
MIAHEHLRMHPPTATAADFSQPAQENQAVVVGLEHRFPAIAAGHHLIDRTGILKTSPPCHAPPKLQRAIA